MSPPYPVIRARFDRAIAGRDLGAAREAAREFSSPLGLIDALQVLLLMLEVDDPTYDAAAVRWVGRFAIECRGVTLTEIYAAAESLDALPSADAEATLTTLIRRRGESGRAASRADGGSR